MSRSSREEWGERKISEYSRKSLHLQIECVWICQTHIRQNLSFICTRNSFKFFFLCLWLNYSVLLTSNAEGEQSQQLRFICLPIFETYTTQPTCSFVCTLIWFSRFSLRNGTTIQRSRDTTDKHSTKWDGKIYREINATQNGSESIECLA